MQDARNPAGAAYVLRGRARIVTERGREGALSEVGWDWMEHAVRVDDLLVEALEANVVMPTLLRMDRSGHRVRIGQSETRANPHCLYVDSVLAELLQVHG